MPGSKSVTRRTCHRPESGVKAEKSSAAAAAADSNDDLVERIAAEVSARLEGKFQHVEDQLSQLIAFALPPRPVAMSGPGGTGSSDLGFHSSRSAGMRQKASLATLATRQSIETSPYIGSRSTASIARSDMPALGGGDNDVDLFDTRAFSPVGSTPPAPRALANTAPMSQLQSVPEGSGGPGSAKGPSIKAIGTVLGGSFFEEGDMREVASKPLLADISLNSRNGGHGGPKVAFSPSSLEVMAFRPSDASEDVHSYHWASSPDLYMPKNSEKARESELAVWESPTGEGPYSATNSFNEEDMALKVPLEMEKEMAPAVSKHVTHPLGIEGVPVELVAPMTRSQGSKKGGIIESRMFYGLWAGAVLANCGIAVVLTEVEAQTLQVAWQLRVFDYFFTWFFIGEVGARLVVYRGAFFRPILGWNMFDLILAVSSLVLHHWWGFDGPFVGNFATLRVMRIVGTLRIFREIHFLRKVHLMMRATFTSFATIVGSSFLLMIIFSFAAMSFVQVIAVERRTNPALRDDPVLEKWFGTTLRGMLVLFQCTTGGVDWAEVYDLLEHYPLFAGGFILFMFVTLFCLFNVILSVFVEKMVRVTAHRDENINDRMEQERYEKMRLQKFIGKLSLQGDKYGEVSISDLEKSLMNPEVREFFMMCGLRIQDADIFFKTVVARLGGRSDFLTLDLFVELCMILKGPASNLDMQAMKIGMQDMSELLQENAEVLDRIEARFFSSKQGHGEGGGVGRASVKMSSTGGGSGWDSERVSPGSGDGRRGTIQSHPDLARVQKKKRARQRVWKKGRERAQSAFGYGVQHVASSFTASSLI